MVTGVQGQFANTTTQDVQINRTNISRWDPKSPYFGEGSTAHTK